MPQTPKILQYFAWAFFIFLALLAFLEATLRLTEKFRGPYPIHNITSALSSPPSSVSPDQWRILCLGDSITYGQGLPSSYPEQLKKILRQKYPLLPLQVINAGVPGATSDFLLAKMDQLITQHRPHIVIAMMGHNDQFSPIPSPGPQLKIVKFAQMWWRQLHPPPSPAESWQKILSIYQHHSPTAAPPSPPVADEVLQLYQKAQTAFAQFDDQSLKQLLLKLSTDVLNFPFVYWIQSRWRLDEDPQIAAHLRWLWKKATPKNPDFWNLFAHLFRHENDAVFLQAFSDLLHSHAQAVPPISWAAQILQQRYDFPHAQELYQKNFELHHDQAESLSSWAHFLLEQKDYQQLGKVIPLLAQRLPDEAKLLLSRAQYAQGNYERAIATFEQLPPAKSAIWLAQVYGDKGAEVTSQTLYWAQKAQEFSPQSWWAHHLYAEALWQADKKTQALAHYQIALQLDPQNHHNYLALAQAYKDMGRIKEYEDLLLAGEKNCPQARTMFLQLQSNYYLAQQEHDKFQAIQIRLNQASLDNAKTTRTMDNYFKLWQKLSAQNITLLTLPYPGANNAPFKQLFTGRPKVLIADNRLSVEGWTKSYSQAEIFADLVGGYMGHMTALGHQLLAQHLANILPPPLSLSSSSPPDQASKQDRPSFQQCLRPFLGTYQTADLLLQIAPAECKQDCFRLYLWTGDTKLKDKKRPCGLETYGGRPLLDMIKRLDHNCDQDVLTAHIHFYPPKHSPRPFLPGTITLKQRQEVKNFIKELTLKRRENSLKWSESYELTYHKRPPQRLEKVMQIQFEKISDDPTDEKILRSYKARFCPGE